MALYSSSIFTPFNPFLDLPEFETIKKNLNSLYFSETTETPSRNGRNTYPPYDVVKMNKDGDFRIELACAGYDPSTIKVDLVDDQLRIEAEKRPLADGEEIVSRGISRKGFRNVFTVHPSYEVSDVTFDNGLLLIQFTRKPDSKKSFEVKTK